MIAEVSMADSARRGVKRRRMLDAHGWVCHLCGNHISPMFHDPHPDCLTIDHVIPVSKGGSRWDVDNMRPAHKRCNEAKGNGEPRRCHLSTPLTHRPFRRFGC